MWQESNLPPYPSDLVIGEAAPTRCFTPIVECKRIELFAAGLQNLFAHQCIHPVGAAAGKWREACDPR